MTLNDSIKSVSRSSAQRPLTGRKFLAILLAGFGVVAFANATMVYFALTTFRGEVEDHPYDRGLAYNSEIANARAQAARDWNVEVLFSRQSTSDTLFSVHARDGAGADVSGVTMTMKLESPADMKKDVPLTLNETAPGRFEGRVSIAGGWRNLVLTASHENVTVFRSKSRIHIE